MNYSLDFGLWNSVFAVPSQIVDYHLKMCGAAHLKVLLVLLRNGGAEMSLEQIAAFINLTPGDTQDALNYWLTVNVLKLSQDGEKNVLSPNVPTASPALAPALSPMPATPPATLSPAPAMPGHFSAGTAAPPAPDDSEEPETSAAGYAVGSRPLQKPQPAEISAMSENCAEFKALLQEAEASLGKPLTTPEVASLASLYSWAGIPTDVLLAVMEYCKILGKTNLRYIEKVAIAWLDNGIDTFERAERHIKEQLDADAREQLIKSAFGIYDRALTSKEKDFIKLWVGDYHLDIAVIKLAYERSVENTGKLSFPYIGKILSKWHSQNITTTEQATQAEAAFVQQRSEQAKPKSSYDINEFEHFLLHSPTKPD